MSAANLIGAAPGAAEPQTFVANGQLIRDARLDRYLAAHKQFAGSSALGVPSGFLRNATAEAMGR
jgi:sigma-E factor negative regulatory protein RseA